MAIFGFFSTTLVDGTVYSVGDSAGWTGSNIDYHMWASTKTFQVGDTLGHGFESWNQSATEVLALGIFTNCCLNGAEVFQYNQQLHNVVRVSLSDFHSCNAGNPIATYSSGNYSITIVGPGHYYYICGFRGHCQAGQKLDIRVPKAYQLTDIRSRKLTKPPVAA
uniref:Mavicyanin-like n=1 Tax=Nicotiana tabacum TaxID=4097 RepID=A0A1S3Y4P2_TOBAC|nr:PREDICTED: mavicyanin-like [Nicotiana tabacum]